MIDISPIFFCFVKSMYRPSTYFDMMNRVLTRNIYMSMLNLGNLCKFANRKNTVDEKNLFFNISVHNHSYHFLLPDRGHLGRKTACREGFPALGAGGGAAWRQPLRRDG